MRFQSLFCPTFQGHQLHVMHVSQPGNQGEPVLMVHGMVEDGRIFYHKSGKGLACYLASQGFDVYVADLRGIGLSTPKIDRLSEHGQTETIRDDIPELIDFVLEKSTHKKLHLVAHSWGGVNSSSALLRKPEYIKYVASSVYFGSKRTVRAKTFDRYLKVELVWNRLAFLMGRNKGYLPAKRYGLGSENETLKTHKQCVRWVKHRAWQDSDDGFDYAQAAIKTRLPATLYFAAIRDTSLGHRYDVRAFIKESGEHVSQYTLLAKSHGNELDYDHIDMLTAKECVEDHFPEVSKWFKRHR